jgi:hypothetical protein
MDIILIVWTLMMSLAVLFTITEYIVGKKLNDKNRFKKWWRKNVIGIWNSNHPRV